jgi:DNA-binding protein H-NS
LVRQAQFLTRLQTPRSRGLIFNVQSALLLASQELEIDFEKLAPIFASTSAFEIQVSPDQWKQFAEAWKSHLLSEYEQTFFVESEKRFDSSAMRRFAENTDFRPPSSAFGHLSRERIQSLREQIHQTKKIQLQKYARLFEVLDLTRSAETPPSVSSVFPQAHQMEQYEALVGAALLDANPILKVEIHGKRTVDRINAAPRIATVQQLLARTLREIKKQIDLRLTRHLRVATAQELIEDQSFSQSLAFALEGAPLLQETRDRLEQLHLDSQIQQEIFSKHLDPYITRGGAAIAAVQVLSWGSRLAFRRLAPFVEILSEQLIDRVMVAFMESMLIVGPLHVYESRNSVIEHEAAALGAAELQNIDFINTRVSYLSVEAIRNQSRMERTIFTVASTAEILTTGPYFAWRMLSPYAWRFGLPILSRILLKLPGTATSIQQMNIAQDIRAFETLGLSPGQWDRVAEISENLLRQEEIHASHARIEWARDRLLARYEMGEAWYLPRQLDRMNTWGSE